MKLKQQCPLCNSWRWCGNPCRNAPVIERSVAKVALAAPRAPEGTKSMARPAPKPVKLPIAPPKAIETHAHSGRPKGTKVQVTIRLEVDILAKFKATGDGWQSRINEVLRAADL